MSVDLRISKLSDSIAARDILFSPQTHSGLAELVVANVAHWEPALSDQHSNRHVDQNRRPSEIGDASRKSSGEIARGDLVREAGLERQQRVALPNFRRWNIMGYRDRNSQRGRERFCEAVQLIEIERVGIAADAEVDRRFEMVEMPRGASRLENRHDGGDAGAPADADNRPLLLRREVCLAQRTKPFDGIAG